MSRESTFWARRRAAVAAEADADQQSARDAADEAALQERLEGKDDAEILRELGLPDPEEMLPGDDFSAFMARQVPEHLRRMALKKLWRSNPVLACVDGLNDYDDDYRAAALAQGPVKTTYQVGKGMLAHLLETERPEEADEACEEVTVDGGVGADRQADVNANADVPVETVPEAPERQAVVADTRAEVATDDTPVSVQPRRMRFSFAEAEA